MIGPYKANSDKTISYLGNKLFKPVEDVTNVSVEIKEMKQRVHSFKENAMWVHIAKINHTINKATNDFFSAREFLFTPLPLTTRMISSPGAVYGKEAINYTTDTSPIRLEWFNLPNKAFLSESSQIYLELALTQDENLLGVYSIYSSFRKEKADYCHLPEFHHIEFEGKVNQKENIQLALELLQYILQQLLSMNKSNLQFFLEEDKIQNLTKMIQNLSNVPIITFQDALDLLYKHTQEEKYKEFSLKHFGAWEEIKLTEIMGSMVIVKDFPLLEVPFYHKMKIDEHGRKVADCADIIWPGYREIIGSGQRIGEESELKEKAEIFSLPTEDYEPYMQSRQFSSYQRTSGFGLGWERLLQGILETPFIWTACHFPRIDVTLKP